MRWRWISISISVNIRCSALLLVHVGWPLMD